MTRAFVYCTSLLTLTLALTFMGSGCGGPKEKKETTSPPPAKGDGSASTDKAAPPAGMKKLVKAGDGTITGKVTFAGSAPECVMLKEIKMKEECQSKNEHENCEQLWTVGKDNAVANVLVVLKTDKEHTLDPGPKVTEPAVMDQPHCAFLPHVIALKPGQPLLVKNSAKFAHNTKVFGDGTKNKAEQGETIPPGKSIEFNLKPQKMPLRIACDVHAWMNAKVWAMDNPYFAVTGLDGTFKIENVPTGVPLTVEAWHENVDFFDSKQVKLDDKGSKTIDFSVKAK